MVVRFQRSNGVVEVFGAAKSRYLTPLIAEWKLLAEKFN
jgi:hypothetical protein